MATEPEYDDVQASDELVAALASGGALSFAPDEDDDLLPGARPAAPVEASATEAAPAAPAPTAPAPAAEPAIPAADEPEATPTAG
jgi:hypothetical protein